MNSPEDILKETVSKLQEIINPLVTRIEQLEHTVNDVIIKSALDIDHEDRYNATKEKWSASFEPYNSIMEIEGYDPYSDITDNELDDDTINAKLSSLKEKLEQIIASAKPEMPEEQIEEVAEKIEEIIEETSIKEIIVDDSDIQQFKKGGRIRNNKSESTSAMPRWLKRGGLSNPSGESMYDKNKEGSK